MCLGGERIKILTERKRGWKRRIGLVVIGLVMIVGLVRIYLSIGLVRYRPS